MSELSPETIAWLHQAARVDGATYAQVLLLILERLELLEKAQREAAMDELRKASAELQSDHVPGIRKMAPAPEVAPVATDEELRACATRCVTIAGSRRACYDLGREHGAAQARCPHIRSSDEGTSYCGLAEQTAAAQPTPPAALSDALARAECALSDIAEGEPNTDDGDPAQWAERRCADALAIIRPVMRQHGIRTSEWPGCGFNPPQPNPPDAPAGGLVERVARSLGAASGLPDGNWDYCADAAIREVAAWLRANQPLGISAVRLLEQEADRG